MPEGWIHCYLKEVISLVSGNDLERSKYWEKPVGIPYITGASNFINSNIETSRYTDEKYCNSYYGDILLTCKGTVGKIGYNKYEKAHVARQIMALKAFINNKYLIILLNFNIPNLAKKAKSIIPGIERRDLLYLSIQLPPLGEQESISIATNNCLECIKQISNN